MNFEKKNNIYKAVMLIIITAIITFMITSVFMYNYYIKTEDGIAKSLQTVETTKLETKLQLIKAYLDKNYLGDTSNEDKLIESAVKGYVAGLGDKYTEYLTEEEYNELMVDVNGNYVGIGIYMTQDRDERVVVLLPIEGSPAEEAGLETGDIITKINGEECTGMELSLVANKVKGEEGTTVELEIDREGKIINKTIERRRVEIYNIKSEVLDGNIGYIQILAFDDGCSTDFEEKLDELINKGVKSLIIDVRDNGGGIVNEAIDIAELFLPKDKNIMIELNKNEEEEKIVSKKEAKVNSNINVIVLSNENTASASEIFIGALKDNNIAKIVGTRSFGKGVMQEILPMRTGGALKLTIQEFRTPNGNVINEKGIEPDVEIEENSQTKEDEQLQKAIEICK